MKKIKYRRLAAMAASLLCCLIFTVPAYAQSSEPQPETTPAPVETEAEPETQNPFIAGLSANLSFGSVSLLLPKSPHTDCIPATGSALPSKKCT